MGRYTTIGQALPPVIDVMERLLYDLIMHDSRITSTECAAAMMMWLLTLPLMHVAHANVPRGLRTTCVA